MKRCFFIYLFLLICTDAFGYSLHAAGKAFQLDAIKRTPHAIGVSVGGAVVYGALYPGTAPGVTMHVRMDEEYWLGQNCPAGQYSENGISACTDCTIGHYCPGGRDKKTCTYGTFSCPGTGATTDGPMPDGAPLNKFMTLDEVNEFVPATDISQWRKISCCASQVSHNGDVNDIANACASGDLGPGTYLFVNRYTVSGYKDSLTGESTGISNAHIAVFDHTVQYRTVTTMNIFQHFIDTENYPYQSWTITDAMPFREFWKADTNETNVSNLTSAVSYNNMCIYELK